MTEEPLEPGDRVVFTARALDEGERAVEIGGIVDRVTGSHVWLRVAAGRMCVSRRAVRLVERSA